MTRNQRLINYLVGELALSQDSEGGAYIQLPRG